MGGTNFKLRKIPSTIQRGRMSNRQQHIFNNEFANYCIDHQKINKLTKQEVEHIFPKNTDCNLVVDIGFGNGDQLLSLAEILPLYNFIGIELYKKGIANLISKIQNKNLENIKIIYGEAKDVLYNLFDDRSIFKIQIFFPDPWPKLRHHKRRLINIELINIIQNKLLPNGILHIATDSDDYANHIIKTMSHFSQFYRLNDHNISRPITKFEKIGISLGHNIWDIVFVLQSNIDATKKI